MPGPFDRFSNRAKRVLALAQDEAVRFNHRYIGPEHLLLGLVREGEGAAARALDALDVKLSRLRSAVELLVGRGDATSSPSEIVLHPQTKKIIELAVDEARRLGQGFVGTEHLLLATLREGDNMAMRALESLGATMDRVRAQVIAAAGQSAPEPPAAHLPRPRFGRATAAISGVRTVAREEALALGHDWIGTEHLLLAVLRPAFPFTVRPLLTLGITYEKALAEVVAIVPRTDGRPANAQMTPRTYGVIGYAKGVADFHALDGSRALLIALVADDEGIAGQVLAKLGATAQSIFEAMDRT